MAEHCISTCEIPPVRGKQQQAHSVSSTEGTKALLITSVVDSVSIINRQYTLNKHSFYASHCMAALNPKDISIHLHNPSLSEDMTSTDQQ